MPRAGLVVIALVFGRDFFAHNMMQLHYCFNSLGHYQVAEYLDEPLQWNYSNIPMFCTSSCVYSVHVTVIWTCKKGFFILWNVSFLSSMPEIIVKGDITRTWEGRANFLLVTVQSIKDVPFLHGPFTDFHIFRNLRPITYFTLFFNPVHFFSLTFRPQFGHIQRSRAQIGHSPVFSRMNLKRRLVQTWDME